MSEDISQTKRKMADAESQLVTATARIRCSAYPSFLDAELQFA